MSETIPAPAIGPAVAPALAPGDQAARRYPGPSGSAPGRPVLLPERALSRGAACAEQDTRPHRSFATLGPGEREARSRGVPFPPVPQPETAPPDRLAPHEALPGSAPGEEVCFLCVHPACRARRAAAQPVAGGHRAEFAAEHRTAAAFQARHPHLIIWFGETTQSYWAATPAGLREAADTDALLLAIWPHTRA